MEVRFGQKMTTKCHQKDLWHIFSRLQDWQDWSGVFGQTAWTFGEPWKAGSRFFGELRFPRRVDVEVVVLKCHAPGEMVLLSHGAGFALELWLQFRPEDWDSTVISMDAALVGSSSKSIEEIKASLLQMFERFFDGLSMEAEKHCSLVAL